MKTTKLILLGLMLPLVGCIPQIKEAAMTPAPTIRVLLGQINNRDSIVFNSTYELKAEEARYEFGRNNRRIYLEPTENGYQIFNENRIFKLNKYDQVTFRSQSDEGFFSFRGRRYPGDVIISPLSTPGISVINRLNLEVYLLGVVPAEMPSQNPAFLEALKAQAICARTYALSQMRNRKNQIFDVYGDERDQVYGGIDRQTPLASGAVRQTRGDVLMFKDSLATIFFHSNSGGMLEAAHNVWAGIQRPYLRAGQDVLGNEFTSSKSPYFRWTDTLSIRQIDNLFREKFNKSYLNQEVKDTVDVVFQAHVLERTSSGRVARMQITYGDTSLTLQGYEIRRFFPFSRTRNLPSTLFTISSLGDSLLLIQGGGFGHGVGMCQYGAMNMSEKGFRYYDILVNKYFKGTYLKKVY